MAFPQLVWRELLRETGGAVLALATDGRSILAGTASGAFLTTMESAVWTPIEFPADKTKLELAQPVALAPWGDRYIATPNGIFRQHADGASWEHCLGAGLTVAIRTAQADGHFVVVADRLDGVLVSRNGGTDWQPANAGLAAFSEIIDLVLSPRFAQDHLALLVTADATYISRSRRFTWRPVAHPPGSPECAAILAAEQGTTLFIGGELGLFRSDDLGRTWHAVPLPVNGPCNVLATDPAASVLVAAIDRAIVRSWDGAGTWEHLPETPSHVLSLAAPDQQQVIVGTLSRGCLRWEAQSATWRAWNAGLYGRLPVGLLARLTEGGIKLVIADYSGTITHSDDGGQTWTHVELDLGLAQLVGGRTGPIFALTLEGILRSTDCAQWQMVLQLEDIAEAAWLLASDDGQRVFFVVQDVENTDEPIVRIQYSLDQGLTWNTLPGTELAVVRGATLSPDGELLALVTILSEHPQPTLSLWARREQQWIHRRWPDGLDEASLLRLSWSASGDAILTVADEDVWLIRTVHQRRPRIVKIGRLESPATALSHDARTGWLLATGTTLWQCNAQGQLQRLEPECPGHTIVALANVPSLPQVIGYAADAGGSLWSCVRP
ncbi:hypothetical protein NET03_03045 [Thermomicrobium sp. CFH 73360]|uniref:WD40/YVTN/BNR-like repeat-containing protein n=1 Tax=Thermomicrobium sp. CFH 73360 TaxID=2951987 RepID=UPI002076BA8C|nr:hypothetical protein [Thermomicrobium sp. CFH 73360]MCM8745500.1 hypothetical protein [Thermomicrobium sp. CFH 73360]